MVRPMSPPSERNGGPTTTASRTGKWRTTWECTDTGRHGSISAVDLEGRSQPTDHLRQGGRTMTEVAVCKNCGQPAEGDGYKLPLCASCRDVFARRPLPASITGV